jgi:His/Glu/Gln/Arg/opine family amino acid ABC transporter permease subunit
MDCIRMNSAGGLIWRWLSACSLSPHVLEKAASSWTLYCRWAVVYPIIVWVLLYGGFLGLERVETRQWGGLTLTLIIASVGIAGALPWGILLALGRRSKMPVVRVLSVIFIEFWRGVPLITVLFMSSVMLPLFMAEGTTIDKLIRALVGVILFQSAYVVKLCVVVCRRCLKVSTKRRNHWLSVTGKRRGW